MLRSNWNEELANQVERAWLERGDAAAAGLIAEKFPTEYLLGHFDKLEEAAMAEWQLRRLYLRVAEVDRSALKRLKLRDEISYCYVLAKLGGTLDAREAKEIFERHVGDERDGLLIWCFGQLGLWDVLHALAEDRERMASLRAHRRREAVAPTDRPDVTRSN